MTWLLVLAWLLIGLLAGALAHAARLGFAAAGRTGRDALMATLGLGVGAAVTGGLLGWFVFGRFFAVPTVLWVAVLVASAGPWLAQRVRDWRVAQRALRERR